MLVNIDNNEFLKRIESLLPNNRDYYYFDINNLSNLHKVITEKTILKEKNLGICLDCSMEGFQSMIPTIYSDLIIDNNINEDDIFLVSGAADIQKIVKDVATAYKRKPFSSVWMREFEHMMSNQMSYQIKIYGKQFESIGNRINHTGFIKSFISLNRRWRLHRPVLVGMLAKRDLLKRGYVSLTESDGPSELSKVYDSILSTHVEDKEIFEYFKDNFDYLNSLFPLTIDLKSLNIPGTYNLTNDLDQCYSNSYFSVVTETNFYTNVEKYNSRFASVCEATRFLTEKTFKPMVYKHPFILVTVPNTLELLKDIGYNTFHPYIDESYDKEQDDGKRLVKIIDEVERLSYLNDKQLREFIENTSSICNHNFDLLRTRGDTLFPNF